MALSEDETEEAPLDRRARLRITRLGDVGSPDRATVRSERQPPRIGTETSMGQQQAGDRQPSPSAPGVVRQKASSRAPEPHPGSTSFETPQALRKEALSQYSDSIRRQRQRGTRVGVLRNLDLAGVAHAAWRIDHVAGRCPRPLRFLQRYPELTLVLVVRDERSRIEETLTYALRSDYPGELTVLVVDDGSTDGTPEIVNAIGFVEDRVQLIRLPSQGRARALNHALEQVATPLVATIHADTVLMPCSLRHAVARLLCSPPDTVAVAGSS